MYKFLSGYYKRLLNFAQSDNLCPKSIDKNKNGRPYEAAVPVKIDILFQVLRNKFRHVKHRNLTFSTEYWLQFVVSVDHAAVLLVL